VTDKQKEAYEYWLNGMKYAEIADKCGVSISAVKMWASRDWKNKNDTKVTEVTKVTNEKVTKKSSCQNTKGGQKHNTNAVKHGAYRGFFADNLNEEELAYMSKELPKSEEQYIEEIKITTIREKRLLDQISMYRKSYRYDDEEINILTKVTKIAGENDGKIKKEAVKEIAPAYIHLQALEAELTRVQGRKMRSIAELEKLRAKKDGVNEDLINDNILSLAQIIAQPLSPHKINIEGEGDIN